MLLFLQQIHHALIITFQFTLSMNKKHEFTLANFPRHGYITHLAMICGCSRKTVTRALFQGQKGFISDHVRETFKQLYSDNSIP